MAKKVSSETQLILDTMNGLYHTFEKVNSDIAITNNSVLSLSKDVESMKDAMNTNIVAEAENNKNLKDLLNSLTDQVGMEKEARLSDRSFVKGALWLFGAFVMVLLVCITFFLRPTVQKASREGTESYIYIDKSAQTTTPDFSSAVASTEVIKRLTEEVGFLKSFISPVN